MFFGKRVHSKVLQAEAEHPMEKWIRRRELVGLFFISVGFFSFAQQLV